VSRPPWTPPTPASRRSTSGPPTPSTRVDEGGLLTTWPATELLAHPAFEDVTAEVFRWERALPRADYLTYLGTHSPFLRLDDDTRTRLLAAVGAAVPDQVLLAEDTVLYLATRTA
jgi:hypothetical protein